MSGKATAPPDQAAEAASSAKTPARRSAAPKRKRKRAKPARVGFGAPPLEDARAMERLHCGGQQLPSPMGGSLAELGVRAEPDGTSTVLFECRTSALRFELPMRISTWRERRKVKVQVEEGLEPLCPRGEPGPRLVRRQDVWFCPRCNLKFGRAI